MSSKFILNLYEESEKNDLMVIVDPQIPNWLVLTENDSLDLPFITDDPDCMIAFLKNGQLPGYNK